jgi:N-terminal acetyltransferase B complex non-catalytic subunit
LIKTLDSSASAPTKVLGQSITIFKIQELTGNMYKLPVLGACFFCFFCTHTLAHPTHNLLHIQTAQPLGVSLYTCIL